MVFTIYDGESMDKGWTNHGQRWEMVGGGILIILLL